MANLQDNIRVSTQVDMQQLDELILKYKDLKIRVSDVAAASRAISEQMKRDALEQANATKQATLELQRQQAAVKAVSNELIQEEKVVQQIAKTTESTSRAKTANIQRELAERRNLIDSLTAEDRVAQQVSITASQAAKAKTAAYNQETAAARALLAEEKILEQIERTGIAQKNNATAAIRTNTAAINQDTAAIRQDITSRQLGTATITQGTAIIKQGTAAIQQEKESVRLSTEQQRLYNQQLRNKALESKNASDASSSLFNSLNSLTKLRSELITLFGAYSIGSFAQQMVEAQSKVESFQLGMKNLLGEKFGAKLTDDLKKFTVETPLNFENVIEYTNKLVGAFKATGASSREIQEQVTPILESLGNTAAALGGGDRLGRLIYAFTQVQATGRLMGTEVRQITETGFPLLAVMAQQSGKSVQELQKDISDGKVGFEQFQKAILSAGKEGGVFAGSMDIMANTVQGRIDKMKETVFFALANIGNQFNDSAKNVINFASSIIDSLFGTEDATKKTIDVVRNAVIAWATYELIIRKNSAAQVAWNAVQKIGLIIKGEAILATEAYTGITIAETEAQIAATTAARGFNATLAANPFGFALLALTALVTAYQLYSDTVDEAKEFTLEGVKANDSEIKSLMSKQARMNAVAESLKGLKEGSEGYKHQIDVLKKMYPEYFSMLDGENTYYFGLANAVQRANIQIERKIKLMSMEKLAEKVSDRAANIKLQIAEEEILDAQRRKNAEKSNEQIVAGTMGMLLQQKIIYKGESDKLRELRVKDSENNLLLQKVTNQLALEEQNQYIARHKEIIWRNQQGEFETKKEFTDALIALDQEYGLRSIKTVESTGKAKKDATEKALKYQNDTDKQKAILKEANSLREQQETRDNRQKILDLEKEYAELRVNNAKGSQTQKVKALQEIEKKYREDSANLTSKYDADELKAREDKAKAILELERGRYELSEKLRLLNQILSAKSSDEIYRIEEDAADNILKSNKDTAEKQLKIEQDKLDMMLLENKKGTLEYELQDKKVIESKSKLTEAEIKLAELKVKEKKKLTKEEEKDIEALQRIEERNSKESIKIEEDKYKLVDKLRILQLISKAKSSKEILDIENKENEKILKGQEQLIDKQVKQEKAKLVAMAMLKLKNTEDYKEQEGVILKLEQELTQLRIKLAEFLTDKTKDEIEKRKDNEKKALDFLLQTTDYFLNAMESSLSDSISKTSNLVTKAQLENQKALIGFAKQGISAIQSIGKSLLEGDYFGAALKSTGLLITGIGEIVNAKKRLNEAKLETARKTFEDYAKMVNDGVNKIISRIEDIKQAYGDINLGNGQTIGGTLSKDLGLDLSLKRLFDIQKALTQLSNTKLGIKSMDLTALADILRISRDELEVILLSSNGLDSVIQSLKDINNNVNSTGKSYAELINGLIDAAENIQKAYDVAVSNENKLYETNLSNNQKTYDDKIKGLDDIKDKAISATNDTYDNEVKRINDNYNLAIKNINAKYDLEDIRANQRYSADTLAIMQAGSTQLEALIKNEESLNSVRQDFASKRQYILDTYALANKAITSDMSEEEIAGINNAIKARDEALAKLQRWYNDELTFIVNSEGQKRKQYTDTEKIQNDINDRLEKAAIAFNAAEILRNSNKSMELKAASDKKDAAEILAKDVKTKALAIIDAKYLEDKASAEIAFNIAKEVENERHNQVLVDLERKKNSDIADNYKLLTTLLEAYSQQIASAIENSVDRSSEAYAKLISDLNTVNELLRQIKNNSTSNPLNIGINGGLNITPFEKGTDNTSISLSGQPIVDNRGGKPAILHPEEAVFSKANMSEMTKALGYRPSRDEVIEKFKMGIVNMKLSHSPYVIPKLEAKGIGNVDKVVSELKSVANEMRRIQTPQVIMNERGIKTYLLGVNSKVQAKLDRFK